MSGKVFFQWSDDYSVKVREIDDQHKKLFELANKFYAAFFEKKANSVIAGTLVELLNYTSYHFSTEEKYFEMFDYVKKDIHKNQHNALLDKINIYKREFENEKQEITFQLMTFLRNWLSNHIMKEDKEYKELFNKNGLK